MMTQGLLCFICPPFWHLRAGGAHGREGREVGQPCFLGAPPVELQELLMALPVGTGRPAESVLTTELTEWQDLLFKSV